MTNFWTTDSVQEFLTFLPPLKRELYKNVALLIKKYNSKKILDYGCGEGNQLLFLNSNIRIDLYDLNISTAEQTYKKFKKRGNLHLIRFPDYFQDKVYDSVIVNMVWMCLKDELEINTLLRNVSRVKKDQGIVIISTTHPCFRDKTFSYFDTEYGLLKKSFNYFKEGDPFYVFAKNENKTIFKDYHFSLGYFFKKIKEFNLNPIELVELKDQQFKLTINNNFPPYIIWVLT